MSDGTPPQVPAVVELLSDGRPVPLWAQTLIEVLARRVVVRAPVDRPPRPAARLATSPGAADLPLALADQGVPVAVLAAGPTDAALPQVRRATVLVVTGTSTGSTPSPTGGPVILTVHPDAVDAAAHPPVPPFVRERIRRAHGLPERLLVRIGYPGATPVPGRLVPTALACASAAAVRGPAVSLALALGTPVVTDAATAGRLGARDGVHLLVRPDDGVEAALTGLAADPELTAVCSGHARSLVRRVLDLDRAAAALLDACGIPAPRPPHHPLAGLEAALTALDTPPGAAPRMRALATAATLCDPRPPVELTGVRW